MSSRGQGHEMVLLGRIYGVLGIRGWVKVRSYTAPEESILQYDPWYLSEGDDWRQVRLLQGKAHGKGLVVQLVGVSDRAEAEGLVHKEIAIPRKQLPPTKAGEYYWTDLQGLSVVTDQGVALGIIDGLFETGANDVIVVHGDRDRLIPYLWGSVVKSVDLDQGTMVVDWDPEF